MISLAGTHTPPAMHNIRELMVEHRAFSESAMAARIEQGVTAGDVPGNTDVGALAAYYSTVARGLAVQARDGASRERLAEIGRLAMNAWPGDETAGKKVTGKTAKASGQTKTVEAESC